MELWANSFGLSRALKKDFDGSLSRLSGSGVNGIEPCVVFPSAYGRIRGGMFRLGFSVVGLDGGNWFGGNAYKLTERTLKHGLSVKSAHCALADDSPQSLGRIIEPALAYSKTFGLKYLVISLNAPTVQKVSAFADSVRSFAEKSAEQGVDLLYHNHAAELADNNVIEYIMNITPALGLELDVGWTLFAGRNPVDIMRHYSDRLKVLHIKDIRIGQKGKAMFAAVGEGDLPLSEVLATVSSEIPLVLDQDASGGDIIKDVAEGAANVRRIVL